MYVVPALGGEPTLVAPGGRNPRFSPDGRTIAYWTGRVSMVSGSAGVFLVEAGGGQARPSGAGMAVAMYPVWSPRGNELLVLGRSDAGGKQDQAPDWWILPLPAGEPRPTRAIARLREARLAFPFPEVGFPPLEWGAGSRLEGSANGTRVLFSGTLGDSGNLWEAGLTGAGTADGSLKRITLGPGRQHQAAQVVIEGAPRTVFADLSLNYDIWSAPVGGIIRPVEAEV